MAIFDGNNQNTKNVISIMGYYTLIFESREEAINLAKFLGFWDYNSDSLRTCGQSMDGGQGLFGWAISEYCQDPIDPNSPGEYNEYGDEVVPPGRLLGFYVNVIGVLPPAAYAYLAPGGYGCTGAIFMGTEEHIGENSPS